jgi:sigma-B regulation protein RsbU (phosphoserine phosphatase)
VASAIVNARLHANQLERSQVEHELGLAREIQLTLLPSRPLSTPRIETAAVNVPSSAVGGDYYDYLIDGTGHAFIVIADVSGHGLSAALLTASMRTGFRLLARQTHDPAEIARRLSEVLFEGSPSNQFVAAVIAVLDLERGTLRYCNAGHIPPVVVSPAGDRRPLFGGGIPLGLFEKTAYLTHQIQLTPDELLAFYTDGIPEAEDERGEQLGVDRVEEHLVGERHRELASIVESTRRLVRGHRGRRGSHLDDVTLLTARWRGTARAADSADPAGR